MKFNITKETPEEVSIEVFDEDIGKDDLLGETNIRLREIVESTRIVNKWIPLRKCKSGEVLFSAEFITSDSREVTPEISDIVEVPKPKTPVPEVIDSKPPEELEKVPSMPEIPVEKEIKPEPLPTGSIRLTLHKARNLQKKGVFGKADPYAVLKIGKETFKSSTVKNNQNPKWSYTINCDINKETPEEMILEVFDEDIGKDDLLGDTKIQLREIVHHTKLVNKWIPLKNCKSGEVLFSAEFIPSDSQKAVTEVPEIELAKPELPEPSLPEVKLVEKPKKLEDKPEVSIPSVKEIKLEPLPTGAIKLTLHKARDLAKKGVMGKADP
jgi:Ca2+-dependent lipid-binding protein